VWQLRGMVYPSMELVAAAAVNHQAQIRRRNEASNWRTALVESRHSNELREVNI
jgi:hypothetical protein